MSTPQQTVFWKFERTPGWLGILVRGAGLVLLLLPLVTGHLWVAWLGLPVFFVIWLTARAKQFYFRRHVEHQPKISADPQESRPLAAFPKVTVIAPGRNEEVGVEEAARSLAALDYPDLEVICINDHSTDRTGEILDRVAADHPQLRIVHDPPLQPGWQGKSNAIWYAVQNADPQAKWLLLTDADVVFHPKAVREGVAAAEELGVDFFTVIPYLETGTFVEELVLPIQWGGLLSGSDNKRMNTPESRPVGIGAFILVKRASYLASGGHSAFYAQQPEDALLALAIRQWGGKLAAGWTPDLLRVRLYRGYRQLVSYWVRKNRVGGDDRIPYFVSMFLFWALMAALPFPLAVAAVAKQAVIGRFSFALSAYAIGAFASYWAVSKDIDAARIIVRMRRGIGWLHPLAGLLRLWVEFLSLAGALTKRRMDWRGRDFVNVRAADKPGN